MSNLLRVASREASGERPCQYLPERGGLPARRTLLLELLNQLVVMPSQLGPLGKLILAAGSIQVSPGLEEILLELPLLGIVLGQLGREGVDDGPKLDLARESGSQARMRGPAYHVVDGRRADSIDDLHCQLHDKDHQHQRRRHRQSRVLWELCPTKTRSRAVTESGCTYHRQQLPGTTNHPRKQKTTISVRDTYPIPRR